MDNNIEPLDDPLLETDKDQLDDLLSEAKPTNIEIASYYTMGDIDKANLMIEGAYQDLYVLKLKFSSSPIFGAFMFFYNHVNRVFIDSYGIISQSLSIDKINSAVEWKLFENAISDNLNKGTHDNAILIDMMDKIKELFTVEFSDNVIQFVRANDTFALNSLFKKNIIDALMSDLVNSDVQVNFEEISSFDMEVNSISSKKITSAQIAGKTDDDNEVDVDFDIKDEIMEDEKEDFDLSKVKLILQGEMILSPLKGMHISGLVVKDQIKIRIADKNPKALPIAKAFNAYKDGLMMPITGKIVSFRKKKEGGYKIFVEIAEGIFIRVDEDEEDIKINFVASSPDRDEKLNVDITKYVDKVVDQKKREAARKNRMTPIPMPADSSSQILTWVIIVISIIMIGSIFLILVSIF